MQNVGKLSILARYGRVQYIVEPCVADWAIQIALNELIYYFSNYSSCVNNL